MRRREVISMIGGAIAAIPVTGYAQQSALRVVGVLSPEGPKTGNVDGLVQGLRDLGYVEGRNDPDLFVAESGGLIAYGADFAEQFRLAAGYIDRILKGPKPADLPIEQPTKFDLFINLKAAKVLGLTIPPTLLTTADNAIQ